MSGKILPLSESVRSQLRSGITITNVAQCVEELVLNSIDAQATCVAVRVDPSIFRIQVVDNGIGINYDDLKVLGSRHATSKCHSLDDLSHNLAHYGFRGEALASTVDVAAIVDINTRPRGSTESYSKMFTYGKEKSITVLETSRPSAGTTITIRDFMYNMPVRRKLMKEAIDIENIRIRLQSFALMHPKISFSFRNDNTDVKVLQTTKSSCVMSAFMQLFGCDRAQGLVEVKHSIEPFEISGYISTQPHMTKALQFVYVNKRVILKTKIHKMLNELLSRSSIISSRLHPTTPVPGKTPSSPPKGLRLYSIFIINIECPLCEYDICLDPRKTLVEFKDWDKLLLCIEEMIVNFIHEENLVISLDERFRRSGKDHVIEDDDSLSQPHSSQSLLEVFSLKRHRNEDNSGKSGEKYGQTICTQDNLSAVHSLPAKRVKKKEEELAVQEENNCKVVEKEAGVTDDDILNDDHNANTKIRDENNEEEDEEESSSSQCVFRKPLSPVTKRGKRLPLCNGEEVRSEDSHADKSEERKAKILSSLENFRRVIEDNESNKDGVSCSQSNVSKIQENRYSDDATTLESNKEIALGNSVIRKGSSSSGSDTENKKLSSLEEFLNFYHDDMSKAEQASYKTPHQDILKTPASPPPMRATRSAVKPVSLTQESVCSDISSSHSQLETVKKSPVKKYSLSKVLSENRRKHENKTKSLHALLKYEFQKNKQKSSFEDVATQSKNKSAGVSSSKMLSQDQESFSGSVVLNNRDSSTGVSEGQNTITARTPRSEIASCNDIASVTGEESQESEKIDLESSFNFQPVIANLIGENNCRVEPETNLNVASTVAAFPAEDLCLPSVIGNHFMADHQGERQTAFQYEGLDAETNSGRRTGMQNWERLQGNDIGPESRSIVTSTQPYQPREGEYQSGPDVYNQPGHHQSSGDGVLVKEFPSEGNNQACSSDPEGYLEDIPLIDCIANSFDPPTSMDADAFSTQPFCVESPVLLAKSTSNSPSKEGFQKTWNNKDFIMQSSQGFIPAHVVNDVDKKREEFGVEETQSFSPCNTHTGDMQTILGNEDGRKQQQQQVPLCQTLNQKEVEGDSSLNDIPPVHDEMRLSEDMQFRKVSNMNRQYIYVNGSSYSSSSPKQCSQGELLPLCNVLNVNEEQNDQIRSQSIYCDETPSQDISKSQEVQKTGIVGNNGYVAGKPVQSDNADPFPANPLSASLHFSQLTLPAETEQQSTIHRSDGSDTNNDTMLIPPSLPTMSSLSSLSSSSLSRERSQNFKEKMNSLQITFHGKMIQVNGGNDVLDLQNNNRDVENDKQTSGSLSSSSLSCQVDKELSAGNSIESLAEDQRTEMVGSANAIGDGSSQLGSEKDETSNDVIMQDTVNDDVDENAPANLWKEVSDANGRIMYVNLRTGNTSYKKPEFKEEPEWTSSQPLGAPPLKIPVSYEPGYEPPGKDQTDRQDFVLSHGFSSFLPWKRKEKGKAMDGEKENENEPCKNHNLQTTNLRPESENSDNISPGTQEAIQALLKDAEMEDESVKWLSKPDLKAEVDPQLSKAVQICRTWEAPTFAMDADILSSEVPKSSDRGTITNKDGPVKIYSTVHPYKFSKEMLRSCKVLGQLDNKFIACDLTYVSEDTPQSKESTLIVIFDQHAVHERIRLEKITEENFETLESGESVIRSSAVTPPLVMCLPEDEVRLMLAYDKVFMQRGLHFSEVSSSKVVFHAIPNCLVAQELNELKHKRCRTASVIVESIVRDMCYTLHQTGGVVGVIPKPLVHVLNSQACRGAVKFGDELSLAECQEMITSLSSCQLPFQCAHGRPSIVPIVNITQVAAQQKKDRKPNLKKLKEMMQEHV